MRQCGHGWAEMSIKAGDSNHLQLDKLLTHAFLLFSPDFPRKHLVNTLMEGPFHKLIHSEAFVNMFNKQSEEMCQHIKAGDSVDLQPIIRAMTFDVLVGEYTFRRVIIMKAD
jgi:hypothetical protein